jgi:L-lysine 6-transaminase
MKAKPTLASVAPRDVVASLQRHVLVDGFKLVFDSERSRGSCFVDAATGREFIDLYGFYASQPIGFNHPHFDRPEVQAELLRAAKLKVANPDVYTPQLAAFVEMFSRVVGLKPLERFFFIEGGAPAVENALKAAMDWKVRKNIAAGRGERGTELIHFERAFHGRTGYTLSLTNTDPKKTAHFPKFPWPRISAPMLNFALPEKERLADVIERETRAEHEIREVLAQKALDIAAIIIEPIQGEGGDNHFRGEFFQTLRRLCDEHEVLLIFDEVQCGMGITGKNWCCEHFRRNARPAGIRQKGSGLRRHGWTEARRGKGQLLSPFRPHQLDLGGQLHRLCPLDALSAHHRTGSVGPKRPNSGRSVSGGLAEPRAPIPAHHRPARTRPHAGI